jgi:RimJ/RimL family protein N-acetyltransferase
MIALRLTQEPDLEFVTRVETAAENCPFIGQWSREQHLASVADPNYRHCIIERSDDQKPVGYLILHGLVDPGYAVQIRRIVVTEKGRGYGRKALRLVKQLAFETLGVHRLFLDVVTYNDRARHLYQSEGFVVEGIMRDSMRVGDRFESLILMSILRREYERREHKASRE